MLNISSDNKGHLKAAAGKHNSSQLNEVMPVYTSLEFHSELCFGDMTSQYAKQLPSSHAKNVAIIITEYYFF